MAKWRNNKQSVKGQMVYLTGHHELDAQLKGLAVAIQKKLFRQAARKAARPVLDDAKRNAPIGKTGKLRKAIRLRAMKRTRTGRIGVQVTIGERYFSGSTFYGGFVELGTGRHRPDAARAKKKKSDRARLASAPGQPAQRFMRNAADDNREKAANIFQVEIDKELQAEVAKG